MLPNRINDPQHERFIMCGQVETVVGSAATRLLVSLRLNPQSPYNGITTINREINCSTRSNHRCWYLRAIVVLLMSGLEGEQWAVSEGSGSKCWVVAIRGMSGYCVNQNGELRVRIDVGEREVVRWPKKTNSSGGLCWCKP